MSDQFLPVVPPLVPRRGTPMSRAFWTTVLKMEGWRVEGEIPNIAKAVLIAAPHTSNYDGVYGFTAALALGLEIKAMAKDTLFKPPFKPILNWLNIIPVHRSSPEGIVDQMKAEFDRHEALWIGIAPEGTRSAAEKWKSGFYRMAVGANVPIIMGGFDYPSKTIHFLGVFHPTGDYEKDLETILAIYRRLTPCHPEMLSHPLRKQP